MPKMTLIGRLSDGLPLAASMADATDAYADELSNYDRDAKKLFRSLAAAATAGDSGRAGGAGGVAVTPNQFVTVGAGPAFAFHYLVDGGVVFLTLAEKAYPNRLAYDFLDELRKEFLNSHGGQVARASRPYEFIRFDTFILKTKKLYSDSRTQRNLDKLNSELRDVHSIMTKNISELLERGDRLEHVANKSMRLAQESKKYAAQARHANRMRLVRQYVPLGVVGLVVLAALVWVVRSRG
ncbi:hypothetical protein BU14_1762s0001 [Porphyra umbilicalis]|uniref:Longin domain-containing protein n=1 Tax=Porphyra umbilicalis TaxID=2786 RepID=A0A1X6NKR7_PORUM|nr:hypothetical protein BU14_1762s0001 [Porphyra umbilicalis]|eukprot:OSX69187.1 hypothetical protein BU14_1762s0001 [Porphyra umbilicalis]